MVPLTGLEPVTYGHLRRLLYLLSYNDMCGESTLLDSPSGIHRTSLLYAGDDLHITWLILPVDLLDPIRVRERTFIEPSV